ncbi:fasciclin-like arabinogalactan protein 21 [Tripterygium wilfordii]|uniref:Fasciclin-like arabinogalactan protein 21 n=1 Tax=Tripterygium wilfordii TaxID=458696 RepID=A0A7J7D534_TRIWF|nr:fasciclin-like arabinogalactan protein 21 [Tripterygium wilfordii]
MIGRQFNEYVFGVESYRFLVVQLESQRDSMDIIDQTMIIRLLSSNGFVSFAMVLNAALDEILHDYLDLKGVTIFTPQDSPFVAASPSPMLH